MASYNNRSLFSDYYLGELVGEDSHWRALKGKVWEYRQRISNILEKALPGINGDTPEAEVERRLIRPILDILCHVYFVQPAVPSPEGVRRPDYAFFPSPEARQEAEAQKGKLEFFKNTLAVGDAKAWERSLDKRVKGTGDPFTNHNPSYQIDFYLRATDKRWGLLTNGRHWRLYQRDLSYRLDVYYEVDLPQIITLDEDAFLYFLAFFHKEAFQADGTGVCFLDRAYRASTEYAAKVSEELQDNVYEALRLLAEGFLSYPGNNLTSQELDLVRENAFIVIYRLLFTLYAEAREFLPVTNPTYWGTYSLRALTHEIATKEPFESQLSPTTTMYWSRLRELFNLINSGDDFLHIPPYNGRLFDDQKEHQNLAAWKIGDSYLAAAIDQLARAWAAGRTGRGFVSYRDLSIRELGSIYEGLLEHRPHYATKDMAVIKDDKREKFIPVTELGGRNALKTYRAGSVYLETDKGERKATGSYYTPDYIVKYIVSNTVGPLIEEAKASGRNLIDSILSLKVLDPAMGSGHFLVEVTDYLARALVEALGVDPREMEEDEVRWARREVVERCIYGVDLNPLAVDLAKLSLWLSTVSLDKPLNFLDHHLRCGNSLIGAKLDGLGLLPTISQKGRAPAGTTLAGHRFQHAIASAVSTFLAIAQAPSDSIEDIHRKESAYETARYALNRVESIADVWTSIYFGNEVRDQDAYERLLSLAEQDSEEWPKQDETLWLDKARAIANERGFFHWEVEVPEVFFDQSGNRLSVSGFDVVVGNPPYGDILSNIEKALLQATDYSSGGSGNNDVYRFFCEQGLKLLRIGGCLGFIIPNTCLGGPKYKNYRKCISQLGQVQEIFDFRTYKQFDQDVFTQVVVIKRHSPVAPYESLYKASSDGSLSNFKVLPSTITPGSEKSWYPKGPVLQRVMGDPQFVELQALCESKDAGINYQRHGVGWQNRQRSTIAQSIFYEGTQEDKRDIAYIKGEDIDRFVVAPTTQRWLRHNYQDYISSNESVSVNSEWASRCPKIVSRQTADSIIAAIDLHKLHTGRSLHTTVLTKGNYSIEYVVALLNSGLLTHFYRSLSQEAGRAQAQVNLDDVRQLPIRHINFTTPDPLRQQLIDQGKNIYEEYLQNKDWNKLLSLVDDCLPCMADGSWDRDREQSDVVHDLLAFLVEEMTRLHKEKQAEIKGFISWLEGYLGVSVEDLKNKTKVKEYWKTDVGRDGFITALEQNRRAIQSAKGIDVTHREPREAIQAEFEKSVAKLKPLLEHIQLTDDLIDQIVYKLYGLTEEEIEIIEGSIK